MKRRFVRSVLTVFAAVSVLAATTAARAQEIQLTGPLKGAPAVRHLRLYRQGRLEFAPTVSFTLLDEYRRTLLVGARLNYNIFDWLGVGVWGAGGVLSTTTDLTDRIDAIAPRDTLTALNVNHAFNPSGGYRPFGDQTAKISYVVVPQLTFIPFRGKLAIFNKIFVDTDFSVSGGVGIVGIQERANCGASGQISCANPASFALSSSTKITGTGAVGLTFYPSGLFSLGVEYRLLPFSWNRAGFDSRGTGTGGNFPDGQVNSDDDTMRFNQMVTIAFGFSFPTSPKLSH
ncbi:MAG: hypothetical protein M3O50_01750 [Myxococcota bacterium]|nr:hypothetical protein [Myxococcota bacterium]